MQTLTKCRQTFSGKPSKWNNHESNWRITQTVTSGSTLSVVPHLIWGGKLAVRRMYSKKD